MSNIHQFQYLGKLEDPFFATFRKYEMANSRTISRKGVFINMSIVRLIYRRFILNMSTCIVCSNEKFRINHSDLNSPELSSSILALCPLTVTDRT